ncbi:hypothetical protein HETIRDRAFT_456506 [Heterobasidion irregulare TC 32-1]|uniref:Amine oxidase domain-containing protein n=1 Tax=Heterobasidion irregulare (strain TC 32-1) TaxID=747525 RepID=W4JNJ5_HETIT|nr:uncharacterized protein HETIRDRAFT_456506 [Heterobasidion irregulare TC 32-1]ETW75054.1 hypothetical protein HETIRDRAFT_456506 [Heterobasidion irregulare TC 32-1]
MPSVRDEYALDDRRLGIGIVPPLPPVVRSSGETITVGIIGAGVAGLFTAMLLEKAIEDHGLDIKYEILEAETVEGGASIRRKAVDSSLWRLGERLLCEAWISLAVDRGAMRFPDIAYMKPARDLCTTLGPDRVKIPHIMSTQQNIGFFNGKRLADVERQIKTHAKEYDPFRTGARLKGSPAP